MAHLDALSRRHVLAAAVAGPVLASVATANAAAKAELDENQSAAMGWLLRRHLLADSASPVLGNPDGTKTVVEFFDYRCGYCRMMAPRVAGMIDADSTLRFVMKEYPVLGPPSVVAAKAALVAARHGAYRPFHEAMYALSGPLDKMKVLDVARQVGLDPTVVEREMEAPEILAELRTNIALGTLMRLNGTPVFVVNNHVVQGAISEVDLRKLIADANDQD